MAALAVRLFPGGGLGPVRDRRRGVPALQLGGAGFVVIYALYALSVIYHPVHLGLLMALSMALVMIGAQSSSMVN